jgi:hypothetical protein
MNARETLNGILDLQAACQCGNALRVAVATARELNLKDDVGFGVNVDVDLAGANALCGIGDMFCHVLYVLSVDNIW